MQQLLLRKVYAPVEGRVLVQDCCEKKERNGQATTTRELDTMEQRHIDRDVEGSSGYLMKMRSADIACVQETLNGQGKRIEK